MPAQTNPQSEVGWQATRLVGSGSESLAARASKRLKSDELLLTGFAPTRLRMELDRVPLWRGKHVAIRRAYRGFR